jgi:hypothetical protein
LPTAGAAQPDISLRTKRHERVELNIVGSGELADYLGVSSQSIAAFANDGKVVRISRGKYDLRASVQTYTSHLREVAAARGGEAQILDLTQERARLAKEQADGQELKNRQLRSELLPAADVERMVGHSSQGACRHPSHHKPCARFGWSNGRTGCRDRLRTSHSSEGTWQ